MLSRIGMLLSCALLANPPVRAELKLSVDMAVVLAIENHPDLVAARSLVVEAQARLHEAGRLSNPEFEVEGEDGAGSDRRVSLGITQRFPLKGRLRFESQLSALEVERAELEVRDEERRVALETRRAYHELVAAKEERALIRRQCEWAETFTASLNAGLREGLVSGLEAERALLMAEKLRMAEISLESAGILASARLNRLLGWPVGTEVSVMEFLELPEALPEERRAEMRADLRLAELSVRIGETDVSWAKASRLDDLGVGLFVEEERDAGTSETLTGLRLKVPLPLWRNGKGNVAEKEAARVRRDRQKEALRYAVGQEVLTTYRVMATHYRAASLSRDKLVIAAQRQVVEAETLFGRGELDLQSVFQVRELLVGMEVSALAERRAYFLAHSDWLAALGVTDNTSMKESP